MFLVEISFFINKIGYCVDKKEKRDGILANGK